MAAATRRGVFGLIAVAALAGAGATACSAAESESDQRQHALDETADSRAVAAARGLAAQYPSIAAAGLLDRVTADQFRAHHEAHVLRLGASVGAMATASGAMPTSSAATGTPPPSRAALGAAELAASTTATADTATVSGELARLLAAIAACRALHAATLDPATAPSGAPPQISISADASANAAQNMLAAEDAVIFAFGALGALLPKATQDQVHADFDLHREQRDLLQAAIASHGGTPVAAAAAYQLPFPVTDAASATQLAALVESRLATAYADAVLVSATADRAYAVWALTRAAARAHAWGSPIPAFPGLRSG
jgi:hypothetical protein